MLRRRSSASRNWRQIASLACSARPHWRDWQTASAIVPRPAQISRTPRGWATCCGGLGVTTALGRARCASSARRRACASCSAALRGCALVALVERRLGLGFALGLVARRLLAPLLGGQALGLCFGGQVAQLRQRRGGRRRCAQRRRRRRRWAERRRGRGLRRLHRARRLGCARGRGRRGRRLCFLDDDGRRGRRRRRDRRGARAAALTPGCGGAGFELPMKSQAATPAAASAARTMPRISGARLGAASWNGAAVSPCDW